MNNIQRVGQVIHKPNWNGGQWIVKDKNDKDFTLSEFKALNNKLKVVVKGRLYKAKIKDVTGTDHDMGHTYDWKNIALFAVDNIGTLGNVDYDLSGVCSDGKSKVYLEIHDE